MSVKAMFEKAYGTKTAAPTPETREKVREFVLGKVSSAAFFDELEKLNRKDLAELEKAAAK